MMSLSFTLTARYRLFISLCVFSLGLLNSVSGQNIIVNPGAGSYPTLKDAFDAINAGTHTGAITISVVGNTTEASSAVLNASGTGAASYTSIGMSPSGGAARTITGAITGMLIDLNGADNVTIDGLNSGGNSLTISNTATGAANTIRFINDASNNVITKCTLLGSASTVSNGVVFFSTGTTTGNDNNNINNCNIKVAGANLPINGIFSSGTSAAIDNSGITINANNISEYFSATLVSNGINLSATGNSNWTITNNKLFQPNTLTYTTANTHTGIFIGTGSGYTISNNSIGFADAVGAGTTNIVGNSVPLPGFPGSYTPSGTANATRYIAISCAFTAAGAVSTIQNNTIAGFALYTSSGAATTNGIWCGINVTSGNADIGTVMGNTIGSTTGVGSIYTACTTTAGTAVGIFASSVNTINISNNIIGAIDAMGTTATLCGGITAINSAGTAGNFTIMNNSIGNATNPNFRMGNLTTGGNLSNIGTTFGVASGTGTFTGILNSATGTVTIGSVAQPNIIQNASLNSSGTGSSYRGINISAGTYTITSNTIRNITSPNTNTTVSTALLAGVGILSQGGTVGSLITQNTINNLELSSTTTTGTNVTGIGLSNSAVDITRNRIYDLRNASTSTTIATPGSASGIFIRSGTAAGNMNIINNMISLGNGQTTNTAFIGIWGNHGSSPNPNDIIYFNSIHIEGTVTSGAIPSFGFHRGNFAITPVNLVTVDIRNNIFDNTRTGGTGKHYAIGNLFNATASATGWGANASNYNVLNSASASTVGFWTTDQTFAGWQAASAGDVNSYSGVPVPFVNAATADLHIVAPPTPVIEGTGTPIGTVIVDYDGQTRASFSPTDIGADADNFFSYPIMNYTPVPSVCATGAQVLVATITDVDGVPTAGIGLPVLYWKVNAGAYMAATAVFLGGSQYQFTFGGTAVIGDVVSYYLAAQDNLGNVGTSPGFGSGGFSINPPAASTPPSSPNTYSLLPTLSGTYTVGVGGNYTTLTAAVNAYNTSCLGGPVIFSLIDPSYPSETFPININSNPQASAINTLTIKPAVSTSISGSSTLAMITMNGADYITIDGSIANTPNTVCPPSSSTRDLTITNTSATTSSAIIWLGTTGTGNAVTNCTVKNCILIGNAPTTTIVGLGAGGPTIGTGGTNNDNISFINNDIRACQFGIYSSGASATNKNQNLTINLNFINTASPNNVGLTGIYSAFTNNIMVSGNNVGGMSNASSSDVVGINMGMSALSGIATTNTGIADGVSNVTLTNNNVGTVTQSGTFAAAGIAVGNTISGTTLIANNMVTGVNCNGTSTDFGGGIVVGGGSAQLNVFHNSVAMQGTITGATAASSVSTCFAVTSATPAPLNIKNNLFINTQAGNASATLRFAAIALGYGSPYTNLSSNFNDLFSGGPGPGTYVLGITGGVAGTSRVTLLDWQTETGQDLNSLNFAPVFVSTTNLHLVSANPTNTPLLCGGTATPVTTDFDCEPRSNVKPTIGLDEIANGIIAAIAVSENSGLVNNDGIICAGSSVTLTASGGGTYAWSTGATTAAIVVNPASTTTYTVTVTVGSCANAAATTITVNPVPVVTITVAETSGVANNDGIICSGANVTLTSSAGIAYAWSTGATTQSIMVAPTMTTVYTVTVTDMSGCTGTATTTITVNPLPTPTILVSENSGTSGNDGIICAGASATLTATGGTSFAWSTGATTPAILVTPAMTTAYTVTVTDGNGCSGSVSQTITVNPNPTASISVSESSGTSENDGTICSGATATLTAFGGVSFFWSTGQNTQSIMVSPLITTVYSVTVTNENGCTATASTTITVTSGPAFTSVVTNLTSCTANDGAINITITAGVAPFIFTWSTANGCGLVAGMEDQSGLCAGTYNLTVTDATTCSTTATFFLDGPPPGCLGCPTITSLTASPNPVCSNVPTTLTASGLTGMGLLYGITFVYYSLPTADPYTGGTIIATVPNGSLGGGGTFAQTTFTFAVPGTYYVYAILSPTPTDPGCRPSANTILVSNAIPIAPIAVQENSGVENNDGIICAGASATLIAPGGSSSYMWSTGETTQIIMVSPLSTTTYTVTLTNGLGCSNAVSTTITVNPLPVAAITPSTTTICAGGSAVLTASGGGTYLWSTGATTPAITVSPMVTTTFSVTVTSSAGCSATATATVNVNPVPQVNAIANMTYCAGSNVPSIVFTSNVPGAVFTWSRTVPTPDIGLGITSGAGNVPSFIATNTSTAPITSTFSVVASFTANGVTCTGTPIQFTLTVNPNPQVNAVTNMTYCAGATVPSVVFTSNVPGAVFTWSRTAGAIGLAPLSGTGNVPSFTATNAGITPISSTFSVVASFTNNGVTCTGTPIQFTITINPVPTVNAIPNQTVCAGTNIPSIVFGSNIPGVTFTWSRTVPTPDIGAIPTNGIGNVPAFTATNTSGAPITSTFTVFATYTGTIGSPCPGPTITFTITVNPTPIVNPVTNKTFCFHTLVPSIVFNSSVPSATINWSQTSGPNIGLNPTSGTGFIPTFLGVNNTNGPVTATFTVTASLTTNGVTCTGPPMVFTITICYQMFPTILGDTYVCPGQTVTYTVGNANPNSIYTWLLQNGGGVILSQNSNSITIQWQSTPGGPFSLQLKETGCTNTCSEYAFAQVFVQGVEALACNDHVQISLDTACLAHVLSGMILEGENENNNNYFVELYDASGNLIPNAILTSAYLGQLITAKVVNECQGNDNSCWGTITLEDKIPPTIACQNSTVTCGSSLEPIYIAPISGLASVIKTPLSPIGPNAGTITTENINMLIPTGGLVQDVNVTVDLDHTWSGDLKVDLISPAGTIINLATAICGAADNWDNVTFDDQALIPIANACNNTPPPAILQGSYIPTQSLATFNGEEAGGTWQLRITDQANGDAGTLNLVKLDVLYQESGPFAPIANDACGEVDLSYTESYTGDPCEAQILTRHWTATDQSGNTATCDQILTIVPLDLANVIFPPAFIGECGESDLPDHTGWPTTVDGIILTDANNVCNLFIGYWDQEINDCGGGRKIARHWSILDWCTVQTRQFIQVIKLSDTQPPVLTCPNDFEVGTDFWYCYANVSVPKPGVTDNCSEIANYYLTSSDGTVVSFGNNFVINGLGLGTHTVTWRVTDECGNSSTCSFHITVVDDVVPVANCDQHTVIALTNDGPQGITLIPATVFNDGSYDNCGPVTFRARRMDSCIDIDWTTEGACIDDIPGGIPPVNSRDRGTVHRPCVPFACCDVGAGPIMVELEVTDQAGNKNYCMVEAIVQDKISPFVECPPDIIVSCDFWFNVQEGTFVDETGNNNGNLDEDPLSPVFGNMFDAFEYNDDQSVRQDIIINDPGSDIQPQPHFWGIDGWADDNCEVNLQVRVRVVADCSGGDLPANAPDGAVKLIERRFSASDGNDGVAPGTCTQRIWVVDYEPFYITDNTCNNNNPNDGVIWPCDVLLTDCPEDLGDTGEPTIFDDACSLVGVTYEDTRYDFVDSVCFKILRDWSIIDWCQYNSLTGEGLWHYIQVIKVHDNQGPAFTDCPTGPVTLCVADEGVSLPDNNQAFLGEENPLASSCSVHLNLHRTVHETCSDIVNFDVKLYLNNGDEFIYLKTTTTVPVDENNNADLSFDTRQNPSQQIRLNGIPYNSPFCGDYHRILWSAEDGCGNWSHCEYLIRLEDCKLPSPVCINGLSSVVMPAGGQVTVWAKDFNASSFDDCTTEADLLYSFSGDSYQPSFTYTCDNVANFHEEFAVEIWVADGGTDDNCNGQISWNERNKDFCTTSLLITDNAGVCDTVVGPIVTLAGSILTEDAKPVQLVSVNLSSPGHLFPVFVTTGNGQYEFTNLQVPADCQVTATRDDDHRNGVSTLDLVRIQKHLLGIEPFTDPYELIAADANNSQSVSVIDLVELRKLILGVYTKLPSNTSWRFVDKSFQFTNPAHPWPFDEVIDVPNMTGTELGKDFMAVKIGDVNNSVKANLQQIKPRNGGGVLHLAADDRNVTTGEIVDLAIRADDFTAIEGYQFTLMTSGLEFVGVESGVVEMNDENIGSFGNVLTTSWHKVGGVSATSNDVLFTLHFRAINAGHLGEMIKLNSKMTEAEAYTTSDDIKDVKLSFRGAEGAADFALYQNEPNPFKNVTVIGYDVPQSGDVTLTIFDVTGKILEVKNQNAVKGYNTISVSNKDLPSVGVLYYRLDAGEYSATKKMVLIQ